MIYADRTAAGRALGAQLEHLRASKPLVLGLPRGGVPVAAAVREIIGGDLDILLVRKLGVPWQPELAMGAIGEDGVRVLNSDVLAHTGVTQRRLAAIEEAEREELERRREVLRGDAKPVPIAGRTVVIVDDGMATGATVVVACRVARLHQPTRVVVGVPVSSIEAIRRVEAEADEVVCPLVPRSLGGVGVAYRDFHQLADHEVTDLLNN
ncbi:putative phosphoribosyl transferase [Nocardia amikacinitolerans]|uniref:Putative phosphoribosyl transferase n=1 Tax=Nocardia amikacinitolerans TaxID=756689 RepID=A0A285L6Y8_9NOCA|nr:phosphoribosyltransferase family protein [Nocardia amikacinitolerans]MCP2274891.1 putative phosphoribosyl transferase [Nocardia amikacinitolerans]MCP2290134.1 putative phosphoribosyl transferase [Nocardia amikacinitolerans]MCP2296366.1 putative phosphoribosyl transferase [Nocardia amikacinitolerans]MCP2316198.1 putative phosphoribosyl transferase [Nocardia amikacinitolerans]SNY80678.1 putative phosphoribosyl transferase [Nocardia amikacinitolerans]